MTGRASTSSWLRPLLLGLLVLGTLAMHHLSAAGHSHSADGAHQHPAVVWHADQIDQPETDPLQIDQLRIDHSERSAPTAAMSAAMSGDCCPIHAAAEGVGPGAGPESHRHGDENALWHLCLSVLALAAALRLLLPRTRRPQAAADVARRSTWPRATLIRPLPPPIATQLTSVAVLRL